jgi:hypothetical protein
MLTAAQAVRTGVCAPRITLAILPRANELKLKMPPPARWWNLGPPFHGILRNSTVEQRRTLVHQTDELLELGRLTPQSRELRRHDQVVHLFDSDANEVDGLVDFWPNKRKKSFHMF